MIAAITLLADLQPLALNVPADAHMQQWLSNGGQVRLACPAHARTVSMYCWRTECMCGGPDASRPSLDAQTDLQ